MFMIYQNADEMFGIRSTYMIPSMQQVLSYLSKRFIALIACDEIVMR